MEDESNDIVENTLNVMSNSIGTFDNTLGNVPLYKSGHAVGGVISRFIDKIVDSFSTLDKKH